jgi:PAS domain S-box-containing protein
MKIMIVDDNPADRELVAHRLTQAFDKVDLIEIGQGMAFEAALQAADFDVVLTDYHLHWSNGLEVFRRVRERYPDVPVLMFTDSGNEEVAVTGMKEGLSDYLLKRHLDRLPIAITESIDKAVLQRKYDDAMAQLKEAKERYQTISDLTSDYAFAYRVDVDGTSHREWVTDAFYTITGYTQEALEEAGGWLHVLHPDDVQRAMEHRQRLLANREDTVEYRIITKQGDVRWLQVKSRPIWNAEAGRVVRVFGAAQDITERHNAQQALVQAEKLAITGRLAASLAHEINNPLQTVIGCLGLAEESLAGHKELAPYLQLSMEEIQRAAGIVEELRNLNRASNPADREPTALPVLMERVLTLSEKKCTDQGVAVDLYVAEAPEKDLVVLAAPDRLHQVFLNLILNAVDAMPDGGTLNLAVTPTADPLGVALDFRDSGIGIPPEAMDELFNPFFTTKENGVGLGLYVAHNIVEDHGGTIEIESELGVGTTFTVWLPRGKGRGEDGGWRIKNEE